MRRRVMINEMSVLHQMSRHLQLKAKYDDVLDENVIFIYSRA